MNWFKNLKLGKRLGLGFFLILALLVGVGLTSLFGLSRLNIAASDLATNWLPSVKAVGQLRFDVSEVHQWGLSSFVTPDKTLAHSRLESAKAAIVDDQKQYEPLISSGEERQMYEQFRAEWSRYLELDTRAQELAKQGKE